MLSRAFLVAGILLSLLGSSTISNVGAAERPAVASPAPASPSPAAVATKGPGALDALAWRNVGPAVAGGRLAAVAGSFRDASLVYAGSAGGGVWKSTNGTTSWTPVFDKQSVGSIGAVAVSPHDSNDVWVGTGEANPRNDVSYGDGMYRSRDGGKTWAHLGLQNSYAIAKIALDPRDPGVAVVAALGDPFHDTRERGVYRTTDGGKTWRQTLGLSNASGAADLARSATDPNEMLAAMWQFHRSTWHLTSGGAADGLFRSSDGGVTWKRVTGGGFARGITGRIGVAIAPNDAKRMYAVVEAGDGLLWRSDDAGVHWRMISNNTLIDERPFYYSRIFVDPRDENHLFATSVRLAESKDGGATWQLSGKTLHGDHHDVWFSADGNTVLEGNDGGIAISRDNGATFEWRNNIPIEQAYRVATDDRVPYDVCEGLQDNGSWCGPSDGRSSDGILAIDWTSVGGGDGNWTIPDPLDPDFVWGSSGGGDNAGSLVRYNVRTRLSLDVSPYMRNQNVVPPAELRYRLNWEAPLAFSPFDGHVAYYGGDVVFRTSDAGVHWSVISPDLTRDIKARQILSGTPLRLDVTGAETYDTILDIAPSSVKSGEIWTSTDDGRVSLTRDDGAHWSDVTMPGVDEDARVPTIEASHRDAGTAYAVVDRHFVGDRAPYVYVTNDFGRSWRTLAHGLPADQFARAICEDPRDPDLVFLGLENSVWYSDDRGVTWRALQQNLPHTSVRDLRVQRASGDLLAATHGRGTWILDDITPLENGAAARARGVTLFAPRTAIRYELNTPTSNPVASGENPPGPALFTFYLPATASATPSLDILDAHGAPLRHVGKADPDATQSDDDDAAKKNDITNVAGFNRVAWDLTTEPPVPWYRAPNWNRGPTSGASLLPGTYVARLTVDGREFRQTITVASDPRAQQSTEQRNAHVAYETQLYDALSRIDVALNALDNVQLQVPRRIDALAKMPARRSLLAGARATLDAANALAATLSSHPQNGQDNDFLRDLLRERVQSLMNSTTLQSPTAEQSRATSEVLREVDAALATHERLMKDQIVPLQTALQAAKLAPLDLEARPLPPTPGARRDEHGSREE
jgi:photosystem II stability/assembly factor-like uncharacterized protein